MMDSVFLHKAIELARERLHHHQGGPFAALVVRQGEVIAQGWNQVPATCDPTAHAEIVAIRAACQQLGRFSLAGCELYSTCEPCPMCLAACYWARLDAVYFAADRRDAAAIGFDDERLYQALCHPPGQGRLPMAQALRAEARQMMETWLGLENRIPY